MRLIDADKVVDHLIKMLVNEWEAIKIPSLIEALRSEKECPTVDAVPVVRCKDCIFRGKDNGNAVYCMVLNIFRVKDFYCADGERRTEDD